MIIGIDIGGSHIAIGVIVKKNNEYIINEKISQYIGDISLNDKQKYIEEFLPKAIKAIQIQKEGKIEKIGVGMPGEVIDGIVYNAVNLGIQELEMEKLLKKYTKNIIVRNDTVCAALAEKENGKLEKYDNCIFLGIGTGVGLIVFNEKNIIKPRGKYFLDYGHSIIELNGKNCKCGKKGCLEQYISMKSLKNILKNNYEYDLKPEEIVKIEEEKDIKKLKEITEEYISYVVISLVNLIELFKPEAICLGGSFSKLEGTYIFNEVIKRVNRAKLFTNCEKPEILAAKHNNDAGIIGSIIDE